MGVVAANGIGLSSFWEGLLSGRNGMGTITQFDASQHAIQVGGEVKNFNLSDYVNGTIKAKRLARHTQFAVAAARMGVDHAQLTSRLIQDEPGAAINFGVSTSAIEIIHHCFDHVNSSGPSKVNPFLLSASQPNDVVTVLGDYLGFPTRMTMSTACAAGVDAIAYSEKMIRQGKADLALAGGTDAPINALTLASFAGSGILAEATEPCNCPFDLNRKGGLFAEGAAVLVLERLEHALARGATPIAEILGHGARNDDHLRNTLQGLPETIRAALDNSACHRGDIGYISAHGPGHPELDHLECDAIRDVFGPLADDIPVSSIKGSIGNPLSASGVMQVIAAAMTITSGLIPPTANLHEVDPRCAVHHVKDAPLHQEVDRVLVNAHGMGGSNTCLVIGRYEAA